MKNRLAVIAAKLTLSVSGLGKGGGTALPGLVGEKVDPDVLRRLVAQNFPKGVVVVTGTNGKTTVSRLIADILNKQGITTLQNRAGSNLKRGLISAIINQSDWRGKTSAQMAIFEVDEAYIPIVIRDLQPKVVLVTNLFRDQLDRYGELDSIAKSFQEAFRGVSTKLILNSDDPLVANLGEGQKSVFFGVSDFPLKSLAHDYTADSIFDPKTGEKLHYSQRYFGHIGKYSSKNKTLTRPQPHIDLTKMKHVTDKKSEFDVKIATKTYSASLKLPGVYNVYNALAALAIAHVLELNEQSAIDTIESSEAAFGRSEIISFEKQKLRLLLVKNPTGFNQVIQTYLLGGKRNRLVIAINDNFADGRDVSWLWDSALEDISDYKGEVIVSGIRAHDMALRLKYAGLELANIKIVPGTALLLQYLLENPTQTETYVLASYTAMLDIRKHLLGTTPTNLMDE